jgi:hypothetical protein
MFQEVPFRASPYLSEEALALSEEALADLEEAMSPKALTGAAKAAADAKAARDAAVPAKVKKTAAKSEPKPKAPKAAAVPVEESEEEEEVVVVDHATEEQVQKVIAENRAKILRGKRREESEEGTPVSTPKSAPKLRAVGSKQKHAEDEDEDEDDDKPLTLLPKATKKERIAVTLDSDDDEALVIAPKKRKFELDLASIEALSTFDWSGMELHVSGNYFNLSLKGSMPRVKLDDWTQLNVPFAIGVYGNKKNDHADVALELDEASAKKLAEFDQACGKLFRKSCLTQGKEVPPWRALIDLTEKRGSRQANGGVVNVLMAKLHLVAKPGKALPMILVTRDGKIRIAQGSGLQHFEEHLPKFQNARVRGVLEFPSVYEMDNERQGHFAGLAKPVFRQICVDLLPKKDVPVEATPHGLTKAQMRALMGLN